MTMKPKKRRGGWSRLPEPQASHGFVADLLVHVRKACEQVGWGHAVSFGKHNSDWYITIRLPDAGELQRLDNDAEEGKADAEQSGSSEPA